MSDRGPDFAKEAIETTLDKFLNDTTSDLAPVDTNHPIIAGNGQRAVGP